MRNIFTKNQKGYAILFTIVIVSAISVITAGLANTAYKQLVLSSLAKDSQSAFYQADTASDCALYADMVKVQEPGSTFLSVSPWTCGGYTLKVNPVAGDPLGSYSLNPSDEYSPNPCFRITVTKKINSDDSTVTDTKISAKGYNICNMTNTRTVEREIQINY